MSLLAAIHARWAADSTLNGLLPSTRLITGLHAQDDSDEPTRPFATVAPLPSYTRTYTTGGKYVTESVRFIVYHEADNHDELETIVAAIETLFDNVGFSIDASNWVIRMRLTGSPQYLQDDDLRWSAVVDYEALVRKG